MRLDTYIRRDYLQPTLVHGTSVSRMVYRIGRTNTKVVTEWYSRGSDTLVATKVPGESTQNLYS